MAKKIFYKAVSVYLIANMLLWCLPLGNYCFAQQQKRKFTLAILNLDAKGVSSVEAEVLSEKLRSQIIQLVDSERYKKNVNNVSYEVVEREQMDKILSQFEVQNTGCVSDSCAIEFGKMLQVDRIIVGSIGRVGNTYSVSSRIVDVGSAKTIATADRQYRGDIENLFDSVIVVIAKDIIIGKKKKSKMKYYLLVGAAAVAGGAGAMLGGGGGGSGSGETQLPDPPQRP